MSGGPTEIELKLACETAGLEALAAHPLLADATGKTASRLASTYYDTADRRLGLSGVVLRVRSVDEAGFVQTVKTRGDGLFERGEWEHPLAGLKPSREAIAETPAAELLDESSELSAVFMTAIERRSYLVAHEGAEIEVALDKGRVTAPGTRAREDICEVELELKSGPAASLFSLARLIGAAAELKLGVASKSERGAAIASGDMGGPANAEPVELDADMTAATAFRLIAHGALRQIRLNEDLVLARPDAEALHQLRVGVRRLRSAFSIYGGYIEDPAFAALKDELKRLSEPFGRARDLDVFLDEVFPEEIALRPDEPGLLNLEKKLEARRPALRRAILKTLRSAEWRNLLIEIVGWLNVGAWLEALDEKGAALAEPARTFAAAELEKRLRQVRKRGRSLDKISAEKRHEVRIAAKKLRYGSEFFGSLYGSKKEAKRHENIVKALKKLQGRLGSLNDIATGQALVGDLATDADAGASTVFAAGMTAADIDREASALLDEARKARRRLLRLRPFWR